MARVWATLARGGWAALLRAKGVEKMLSGGEADTTNNRMEMMAAISALEALTRHCKVHLMTDSKYVMQGVQEWVPKWRRNGWKTADKKPVKNSGPVDSPRHGRCRAYRHLGMGEGS